MSSEFMKLMRSRRSVRTYIQKEVSKDILENIFEAARWAPSAHNAQPWRFIVLTEKNVKKRLAEAMAYEWDRVLAEDGVSADVRRCLVEDSINRFTEAPVVIVACITMEDMDKYPDEKRQQNEHTMAIQSLGAALQNMLLAAHSEGLGACWFCAPLFCQNIVREVLGIPPNVEPQALITLGYPSKQPDPPYRKPLSEFVSFNHWGDKGC